MLPPVYALLDTGVLSRLSIRLRDCGSAMLAAGIRLLQVRHKEHWTRAVHEEARALSAMCAEAGATLVINDRADAAALLSAGVHVGQTDLSPADVRRVVGPRAVVGISTHNEAQFRAALAEPVDYIALGPIFGTASKQNPDPVVGLAELQRMRGLTEIPIVAIGGITRENAPEVWSAGADSLAVLGDLYPADATIRAIGERAAEWVKISNNAQRNRPRI